MSTLIQIKSSGGGSASGVFGISNASGVYTYYATLTLAMAAAVSGQVIEMFADVVETGTIEIILKTGVNINGNGHTYTLNCTDFYNAFIDNSVAVSCEIYNIKIIRIGYSLMSDITNLCLKVQSTSSQIKCSGAFFKNAGSCIYNRGSLWGISASGSGLASVRNEGSLYNSYIEATGRSLNNTNLGNTYNCIAVSTGGSDGIYIDSGNIYNSIGRSVTGDGINMGGGKCFNSTGLSTTKSGIFNPAGTELNQCIGISTSGLGLYAVGIMYNCQGISSSSSGAWLKSSSVSYNCIFKSASSCAILGASGSLIYNSTIECNWNNINGNGIQGVLASITDTIVDCVFKLVNATAPYLNNGGTAQAISMRGNTYQGGAAFNVNLTQAIVNTEDNQGNIYL
jgi:hypothetical protein